MVAEYLMDGPSSDVPVIVTVPGLIPLICPWALTVAICSSLDDQVIFFLAAFLGCMVGFSWIGFPMNMVPDVSASSSAVTP